MVEWEGMGGGRGGVWCVVWVGGMGRRGVWRMGWDGGDGWKGGGVVGAGYGEGEERTRRLVVYHSAAYRVPLQNTALLINS